MRVIVTGSRDWWDVKAVTDALWRAYHSTLPLVVAHGGCPTGADAIAALWVEAMAARGRPVSERVYVADWERLGPYAGPERNKAMVKDGADLVLAFLNPCTRPGCRRPKPHDSHGAAGTVALAEGYGIRIIQHRPRRAS